MAETNEYVKRARETVAVRTHKVEAAKRGTNGRPEQKHKATSSNKATGGKRAR